MERLRTPDEAVVFLGLDRVGLSQPRESLRWLCRTGRLRYTKIWRHIRFRDEWLQDCVDQHAVLPAETKVSERQANANSSPEEGLVEWTHMQR